MNRKVDRKGRGGSLHVVQMDMTSAAAVWSPLGQ